MMNHLCNTVGIVSCDCYRGNRISDALDRLFESLGLDPSNPFADIIKPGMRVFVKPNWVASRWRASCNHVDDLYCVITHPAVIEAVVDRVAVALQGNGEILIGDNPSIDADFAELMEHTGIKRLETKYDVPCRICDLRPLICPSLDVYGQKEKMVPAAGDPNGEYEVNLGKDSLLYNVDSSLFRGVFEEREETVSAHTGEKQFYTFANSIYSADVYISIPKLKTHQKVGATLNLKGLVGAITQKNQLVHWRIGTPEVGGDEYPDMRSYEEAQHAKVTHRGAWPGNDTIWRMVVDLYHAFMEKERKYITIIDGIMGGEGQGPFCTTAKYSSCLIGSTDLLLADLVGVRYMGLDPEKIQYLRYLIEEHKMQLDQDIFVMMDGVQCPHFFSSASTYKDFYVVDAWKEIKFACK